LLDGIDAEAARAPPRGEHDGVVLASAHEAKSPLTLVQSAGARTHVALDPPIIQPVPVSRRDRVVAAPHGSRVARPAPPATSISAAAVTPRTRAPARVSA